MPNRFVIAAAVAIFLGNAIPPASAQIACPEAPKQADNDLVIEARGKITGLGRLANADIHGQVRSIVKELYSIYPNADKLVIAQLMVSFTCEFLKVQRLDPQALNGELEKLRSDLLKLMIEEREKENKPKVRGRLDGQSRFSLVNTGGKVRNLDVKVITMIYADLWEEHLTDEGGRTVRIRRSHLPGGIMGIAALTPGIPYDAREDGAAIFSIDVGAIYQMIVTTKREVEQFTKAARTTLELSEYVCPRIEYDDEYGNHYRHFYSLRVFHNTPPREADMHESKLFYEYCEEDFTKYSGFKRGPLKSWNVDGQNGLTALLKEEHNRNLAQRQAQ